MNTLGRELISSDTVALAELVKNSYDAGAGLVLVRISGNLDVDGAITAETGSISVLDDGHGMDEERIVGTWLEPATSFRNERNPLQDGRRVLGEKGVGRFAAAKLGDLMHLSSKVAHGEEVRLSLDWRDFDDDSKYLEDIGLDLLVDDTDVFSEDGQAERIWREQVEVRHDARIQPTAGQGTLIEIANLHSRWTPALATAVHRALSRLVSPFAEERGVGDGFKIFLEIPDELGPHSGEVTSADLLKQSHYSLSAEVEADGQATVLLTLKDRSEREQELILNPSDDGEEFRCGPFEAFLHVWDRDADSMNSLAEHFGGNKLARDALDAASGVSIYRDEFRVLPYGEIGDDWLGLDARRVQNPTLRLSNNQIVGYVLIGRDANPDLVDQSNRERLVETPALADLREAVKQLLGIIEAERFEFRPRQSKKSRGSLFDPIDLEPLREAVAELAPHDARIQDLVDKAQNDFDEQLKYAGEALSRYHRLATLGKLTDMVVHELAQPIFAIRQTASLSMAKLEDVPNRDQGYMLEDIDASFSRIKDQADIANSVVKRIEPFGGRQRGRPASHIVEDAIRDTVDLLAQQISAVKIQVSLPKTTNQVTIDKGEFQQILINLLDNSIYWLRQSKKGAKKIDVSVERNDDGSLSIVVEDSGPGISNEYEDLIFQPYFSTKADGVGLGLAIAGEIVEDYYGGTLELLPSGPLGGARFRATLKKRVN